MTLRVLIVGGGTMGAGIVQSFLNAGAEVWLSEANADAASESRRLIEARWVRSGSRDYGAELHTIVGLPEPLRVELAIEAVPEQEDLKRTVLASIESVVSDSTVIATNTSSLSIDLLGGALADKSRFVGMHFFNPVVRSKLIEIITGSGASRETVESTQGWASLLGKETIIVSDSPGFATSRLGVILGMEAIRMVEEGVATPTDIDRGMELGYGFAMGPLRITDVVGLDVRLAIATHLASVIGERFAPPQLLRDMVQRGELGKKAGKGFFEW